MKRDKSEILDEVVRARSKRLRESDEQSQDASIREMLSAVHEEAEISEVVSRIHAETVTEGRRGECLLIFSLDVLSIAKKWKLNEYINILA
jgi:hypothetical protein